jgi:hypothetical protein
MLWKILILVKSFFEIGVSCFQWKEINVFKVVFDILLIGKGLKPHLHWPTSQQKRLRQ